MAVSLASESTSKPGTAAGWRRQTAGMLFLASFLALYFELLVIRYISTELTVFGSLKNLPLIASFFGIGVGMLRTGQVRRVQRAFALAAAVLFLLARFRAYVPQPALGWQYQLEQGKISHALSLATYVGFVLLVLWLIVAFFAALGDKVGEYLKMAPPLPGYGINLAGSLAGILAFTLLSFLRTPPLVWLAVGFALLLPLWWRRWAQVAVLAALVVTTGLPGPGTYWSPYHRIDIQPVKISGAAGPAAYSLRYNHLWYQTMVNLSPQFMREHPSAEPSRSVRDYYEFPYRLVSRPASVLVVGAGTGNDVAAALRHGAGHVDAVEIDPVILELGRRYHPEQPYASPKVNTYVDDARAFFHKTRRKYDLIVFGFLDSSTLLTGFSSIRLDNYVYTRESFESARRLLKPGGSLVLAFAVTRSFAADRLFVTLGQAFDGIEPRAFVTNLQGMVYVEGAARNETGIADVPEATAALQKSSQKEPAATDNWPFLYLEANAIPASLQLVLALFVLSTWLWQRSNVRSQFNRRAAEFFLLGVGFLLLETNAVTRLALLFGSTWVVNVAVISAFLFMALLANALMERTRVNVGWCYLILLLVVLLGTVLPYFSWSAPVLANRGVLATLWTALPVFFSGLIFSSALRNSTSPAKALAMNLLGAVIGGVLENAVMIGGTALVGILAGMVYACAAVSSMGADSAEHKAREAVIVHQG